MKVAHRVLWVQNAALLAALPGGLAVFAFKQAPLWYVLLGSLISTATLALPGLGVGILLLVAGRERPDGGRRAAMIAATVISIVLSASIVRFGRGV